MFVENGVTKWEIDFPAAFPSLSMYARFEQHSGGRAVLVEEGLLSMFTQLGSLPILESVCTEV